MFDGQSHVLSSSLAATCVYLNCLFAKHTFRFYNKHGILLGHIPWINMLMFIWWNQKFRCRSWRNVNQFVYLKITGHSVGQAFKMFNTYKSIRFICPKRPAISLFYFKLWNLRKWTTGKYLLGQSRTLVPVHGSHLKFNLFLLFVQWNYCMFTQSLIVYSSHLYFQKQTEGTESFALQNTKPRSSHHWGSDSPYCWTFGNLRGSWCSLRSP